MPIPEPGNNNAGSDYIRIKLPPNILSILSEQSEEENISIDDYCLNILTHAAESSYRKG